MGWLRGRKVDPGHFIRVAQIYLASRCHLQNFSHCILPFWHVWHRISFLNLSARFWEKAWKKLNNSIPYLSKDHKPGAAPGLGVINGCRRGSAESEFGSGRWWESAFPAERSQDSGWSYIMNTPWREQKPWHRGMVQLTSGEVHSRPQLRSGNLKYLIMKLN